MNDKEQVGHIWVSAQDCVQMIALNVGGVGRAASALKAASADGVIRSRAKVLKVKRAGGWEEPPKKLNCDIPAFLWAAASGSYNFDPLSGNYYGRAYQGGAAYEFDAQRVSFERSDVRAFFDLNGEDAPSQEVPATEAKNTGGAPAKMDAWHKFYMTAMHLLYEGEINNPERFPTQKSLCEHLLSEINEALSEASVKPRVSRIWRAFRENG